MTAKARSALATEYAANLADNAAGDITPEDVRNAFTNTLDSVIAPEDDAELAGLTLSGRLAFSGTGHVGVKLNSLTTTQRDLLTPAAGDLIYNSTTAHIEAYFGAEWVDLGGSESLTLRYTDAPTAEAVPIFESGSTTVAEWQPLEAVDVTANSFMASNSAATPEIVFIDGASALVRAAAGYEEVTVTGSGEQDIAVSASDSAIIITPTGNITIDQVTGLTYVGQSIPVYLVQDSSDRTVTLAGTTNAVLADSDALDIPTGENSRGRALLVADRSAAGAIVPTFYKVSGPT